MLKIWPFFEHSTYELTSSSKEIKCTLLFFLNLPEKCILFCESNKFLGNSESKILLKDFISRPNLGVAMIQSCLSLNPNIIAEKLNIFGNTQSVFAQSKRISLITGIDTLSVASQLAFRKTFDENLLNVTLFVRINKFHQVDNAIFSRCFKYDINSFSFLQNFCRNFQINYLRGNVSSNLLLNETCKTISFLKKNLALPDLKNHPLFSRNPIDDNSDSYRELTFKAEKFSCFQYEKWSVIKLKFSSPKSNVILNRPVRNSTHMIYMNSSHF